MKIRNLKYVIIIFFLIITMSSCNRNKELLLNNSRPDVSPSYDLQDIEQSDDIASSDDNQSKVSNPFSKYIYLGSYNEIIRLGGSQRDPKNIIIKEDLIIFPEGMIINITTKTSGTFNKFLDVSPDEAKDLLEFIETQKLMDENEIKNPGRKLIGAEIRLILLNTAGKYIMVELYSFDDNNHRFNVYFEDEDMSDINNYYLQSEELTDKIKKLSGWKFINREELNSAKKAICKNVDTGEQTELTSDELYNLINAIIKAKETTTDTSSPYNISIEVTLDNNEVVHMIWAGDSCGNIGIEGSAYKLDEEYVKQLRKMLKEKMIIK